MWTTRMTMAALLLVSLGACSLAGRDEITPPGSTQQAAPTQLYRGMGSEKLSGYRAHFNLQFEGETEWRYELETKVDGEASEYNLHIEGVGQEKNPGDVRVVARAGVSHMKGEATQGACLIYPSDTDLGASFLTPDHVLRPARIAGALQREGHHSVAGRQAEQYSLIQARIGRFRDVHLEMWLDSSSGTVLRYQFDADGRDSFFGAGDGHLSGAYEVLDLGPQAIEDIAGCEVDLPLPPDAFRVVRLPGLLAFETKLDPQVVAGFLRAVLEADGWVATEPPGDGQALIGFSHERGEGTLEIRIQPTEAGSKVEMYFSDDTGW